MSRISRISPRTIPVRRAGALVLGAGLAASSGLLALGASAASASTPHAFGAGASTVYNETNQAAGNAVNAYRTTPGGGLALIGTFPTGGTGTGASPGSQGGVTLGDGDRVLAVVNGGSSTVSVFAVGPFGNLRLLSTRSSGGLDPISVTIHGSWIYALNAGTSTTPGNIAGFNIFGGPTVGAQPLNAAAAVPEEIAYTPNGQDLVVTEKASNTIDVFPVSNFGLAAPAVTTTLATGTGPYGFAFTPSGVAVVSEAAFGGVATFSVNSNGTLTAISQVADGQAAACWLVLSADGSEAFAANAHSGTISSYSVAGNGALTLNSPAVQSSPGVGDNDLAIGGSTLYISDQPNVEASSIGSGGSLGTAQTDVSGDVTGTFGLAATQAFGFGFGR